MPAQDAHRFAETHGHSFDKFDGSWLRPLGVTNDDSLSMVTASRRGNRSLMLSLIKHYQLRFPAGEGLAAGDCWVLRSNGFVQALALRLGLIANAEYVRTAVTRDAIGSLHRSLGKAAYQQAIEASPATGPVQIHGLQRGLFDAAVSDDKLRPYLMTVGRTLLALILPEDNEFAQQRLRFAFPMDDETTAPELLVNSSELAQVVATLAGDL